MKKLLILILLLFTFNMVVNSQGRLWEPRKELIKDLKKTFDTPMEIEISDGTETIVQYSDNGDMIFVYSLTRKIEGSKEQWVQYSSMVPLTKSTYEEILEYLDEFYFARPNTWIKYIDRGGKIIITRLAIPESSYPIFIFEYSPED